MATLPMVVVEVEEKAPVECPIALNRITNVHLDAYSGCGGTGLAGWLSFGHGCSKLQLET